MNEFIVWIDEQGEFLTSEEIGTNPDYVLTIDLKGKFLIKGFNSGDGYTPERGEFSEPFWEEIDATFHSYIGKTDIDGNKIYADSLIIEFEINDNITLKGYFHLNEDLLKYQIIIIEDNANSDGYKYGASRMNFDTYQGTIKNLKIIGTLQENKELL